MIDVITEDGQGNLFENQITAYKRVIFPEARTIFWELEGKFKPGARTLKIQLNNLQKFFKERFLDTIKKYDMLDYIYYRRKNMVLVYGVMQPIKDSTINRELTVMKRIFNAFREWRREGVIKNYDLHHISLPQDNPVSLVPRLSEKKYIRNVILNPKQFKKALEVAHPELRKILVMAILTLLRKKNLMFLNRQNFNSYLKTITGEQSKTQELFKIPMVKTVSLMIDGCVQDFILDFTNFRRRWSKLCEEMGFHFWLRDLRKTGATQLAMSGVDIRTIQELLGHTNVNTTQLYVKTPQIMAENAMTKLGKIFVAA